MIEKFIILADNNADDQLWVHNAFEDIGYNAKIVFVNDGIQLKSVLEQNYEGGFPSKKQCVILLDLKMQENNEVEVLKELKKDILLKEIPVMIYSTSQTTEVRQACYALGAETFIVKPFHYSCLLKVVEDIRYNYLLSSHKNATMAL